MLSHFMEETVWGISGLLSPGQPHGSHHSSPTCSPGPNQVLLFPHQARCWLGI